MGLKAGDKGTTIHRKSNGAAYLYSVKSYWDKEKRQPRNKQVCLGRLNEETGEIIQLARKQVATKKFANSTGCCSIHKGLRTASFANEARVGYGTDCDTEEVFPIST